VNFKLEEVSGEVSSKSTRAHERVKRVYVSFIIS